MNEKSKPKKVVKKPQAGIVSRTKGSLTTLEKREKSIATRIEALQKRIDKPDIAVELKEIRQKEMEILQIKKRQVVKKKESLLAEIRSIVSAFSTKVQDAEAPQVVAS